MITIGRTISYFASNANLHLQELGGKTVIAYPDRYIASPLQQTVFVLGIKSLKLGARITDENGQAVTPYKRDVEVTYFLDVYAPHEKGGDECLKCFDRWMDFLVTTLGYDIASAGSDGMDYIQSVGSNVFKGYFVINRIAAESQPLTY